MIWLWPTLGWTFHISVIGAPELFWTIRILSHLNFHSPFLPPPTLFLPLLAHCIPTKGVQNPAWPAAFRVGFKRTKRMSCFEPGIGLDRLGLTLGSSSPTRIYIFYIFNLLSYIRQSHPLSILFNFNQMSS